MKSPETSPFSLKEVRERRRRSRSHRTLSEEMEEEGELRSPKFDIFEEPMVNNLDLQSTLRYRQIVMQLLCYSVVLFRSLN